MRTQKTNTAGTDSQREMLYKAKARQLGFLETMGMMRLGRQDGKAGLPRPSDEGVWDSPQLNREANAYSEFCSLEWGAIQLDLKDDYAAVGTLIDDIRRQEEALERLRQNPPPKPDESEAPVRMPGEEHLSDGQVCARRRREKEAESRPYYEKLRSMEEKLRAAYVELDGRHNRIIEVNNGARLICQRLKRHCEQRLAVYWNAAIRVHPQRASMPAQPEPLPESEAEVTYLAQHKMLEEEAVNMLARKARLISWQEMPERSGPAAVRKGVA